MKQEYAERQREDDRRTLGLNESQLNELHQYLNQWSEKGCDHTLRFTTEWAIKSGLPVDAVCQGVRVHGGYCDCEVVFNVNPDKFGWKETEIEE